MSHCLASFVHLMDYIILFAVHPLALFSHIPNHDACHPTILTCLSLVHPAWCPKTCQCRKDDVLLTAWINLPGQMPSPPCPSLLPCFPVRPDLVRPAQTPHILAIMTDQVQPCPPSRGSEPWSLEDSASMGLSPRCGCEHSVLFLYVWSTYPLIMLGACSRQMHVPPSSP